MSIPALHTPAEVLDISPEALEVANTYLQCQNIKDTADALGLEQDSVTKYLDRKDVKNYISMVFMNLGFNNRFQMRNLLDAMIKKKLQEMDEAGVGSGKDILEILALSHKFTMEILDREIKLKELDTKQNIRNQTNVQINDAGGNYQTLISKLINAPISESHESIEQE